MKAGHRLSFGAAKATEGVTFVDDKFAANWAGLKTAGLVRMAYHYGHPASDAAQSVDIFLSTIGPLEPTDLLVLDLETGDGMMQADVNAWAKTWADLIFAAAGRRPVLYCGAAYMQNATGIGLRGPYSAWWYPRYPNALANAAVWPETFTPVLPAPNAWGASPDFWQFSSTFPTAEGALDADVFDGTLDELVALNT